MKAVFCDLDETLLVDWHVPEINVKAIEEMRKRGHKFIPCSGRPPFMMDDIIRETGICGCAGEYYICFNGGMLLEAKDNRVLYYNGLTFEEAEEIIRIAEEHDFCTMVVTNECFHIFNALKSEILRKTKQQTSFQAYEGFERESIEALRKETIAKVMFVSDHGVDGFKQLAKRLPERIRDNYEMSFSSNRFMEFNKKGITKGKALKFLAEYLQIDSKDTIAIGDSFNDISMIREAGLGACVLSADPEVKACADYICERDYMDGAVAEVLERFAK